jgi:catechol 2,3-dioxygenase-like lactoylglutathione lyase family enzyme
MQIRELQLGTSALAQQYDFYTRVFSFPVLQKTPDMFVLQAGASRLIFNRTADAHTGIAHFAFNIPENQFAAAKQWLQKRTPLWRNMDDGDEFFFEAWNAHALYFYDPDGNILELIARHTLLSASNRPFSEQSILNISEIGIVTDDVPAQVAAIEARIGAMVYCGPGSESFTPVGDEEGLFIVVKRGRMWFGDSGKAAESIPITVVTGIPEEATTWHFS